MGAREDYLNAIGDSVAQALKNEDAAKGPDGPQERNYGIASTETRERVVALLTFPEGDTQGRDDLLDPNRTKTELIALLEELQSMGFTGDNAIEATSVRGDHGSDPPGSVHGHEEGFAIDIWAGDRVKLLEALTRCRYAWSVGLGGSANKACGASVTWPGYPFVVFDDNNSDHVHVQVANANGGPGPRFE